MWLLPINVAIEDDTAGATVTLAEVMDSTLWDTDPDDAGFCDTYMERCASILPIIVSQSDRNRTNLGLIIPPTFHVDKYLKENVESTRSIRKEMANLKKRVNKIDRIQSKIKTFKNPITNETIDAAALVGYTLGHFNGENRQAVLEDREARGLDLSGSLPSIPAHYPDVTAKLEALCDSITTKLEGMCGCELRAISTNINGSTGPREGKSPRGNLSTFSISTVRSERWFYRA